MGSLILKILLILIGSVAVSEGAPSISGGSGTVGDGNSYTLTGSGFGTNKLYKPTVYANFNGTSDPNSTLGHASAWDVRENMTTSASSPKEGSASLLSDSGWEAADIARVRIDYDMPAGSSVTIALWRKATYTVGSDDNWKWLRLWSPEDTDNFPNFYNGQSPGDWNNAFIEDCPVGTHRIDVGYIEPSSTWMLEEHLFLMPNPATTQNGFWKTYQRGNITISTVGVAFNCSGQSGTLSEISIQDDPSNFTVGESDVVYDLIYVTTSSFARVYISSSAQLNAGQRFLQPFSSWSDTSITITQEHGDLTGTVYAFVCDNNDSCNSTGFELGSEGGPEPDPSLPAKMNIRGKLKINGRVRT